MVVGSRWPAAEVAAVILSVGRLLPTVKRDHPLPPPPNRALSIFPQPSFAEQQSFKRSRATVDLDNDIESDDEL